MKQQLWEYWKTTTGVLCIVMMAGCGEISTAKGQGSTDCTVESKRVGNHDYIVTIDCSNKGVTGICHDEDCRYCIQRNNQLNKNQ